MFVAQHGTPKECHVQERVLCGALRRGEFDLYITDESVDIQEECEVL